MDLLLLLGSYKVAADVGLAPIVCVHMCVFGGGCRV